MKQLAILFIFSVLLLSCKKDKLTGDKSIFIGKWEWIYSMHKHNFCNGSPTTTDVITPASDGNNYAIKFYEKGIVKYYENENYLGKDRLVFSSFGSNCEYNANSISFGIYMNNNLYDEDYVFQGCIDSDTIIVEKGFPFQNYVKGCESYVSYFAKQ